MPALAYDLNRDVLNFQGTPSSAYVTWVNSNYVTHSASFTANANLVLAYLGVSRITVDQRDEVERFLTQHNGLTSYLYDLPSKVREYFGGTTATLGMFSDPDSNDEPEIYLEIDTQLSPEEANEILGKLYREWIFNSQDKDLVSLNLTLRFI